MLYVLILFAHVGIMGDGNSNALSMHDFTSKATCEEAGRAAMKLAKGSVKEISFTCQPK